MESINLSMWIMAGMLWAVGVAAWIMTYVLIPLKAKKTNKNISGIPGVPFFLFLVAGLLTPYKLLALLCLIDFLGVYGIIEIIGLFFSGDLRYDWGKIYVVRMKVLGCTDLDDSVKTKFDEYFKECKSNKELKKVVKNRKFDFERYCRIVAGLRTSKAIGRSEDIAYSIDSLWGMSDIDYEKLKEILPEDVRKVAIDTYLMEQKEKQGRI